MSYSIMLHVKSGNVKHNSENVFHYFASAQVLYLFELFKFHDFFHDLFKFSKTLGLVVTIKNFQNFPCFGGIF